MHVICIRFCPRRAWARRCSAGRIFRRIFPVTRVPTGNQEGVPSILDYALTSTNAINEASAHWEASPADHALISLRVDIIPARYAYRQTEWICRNADTAQSWLTSHATGPWASFDDWKRFMWQFQDKHADSDTCEKRSRERLPDEVRALFRQAAAETTPLRVKRCKTKLSASCGRCKRNVGQRESQLRLQTEASSIVRKTFSG